MSIPALLIFLAIVVYWASCMGRRALTWVAILFLSGCLVYVASFIVAVALEGIAHDQVRDADRARQTIEGFKAATERAEIRRAQASPGTAPADLMQEYLRLEQQQATQADLDAFSARHFPARHAPRP